MDQTIEPMDLPEEAKTDFTGLDLSVVIPAYNEENAVVDTVHRVNRALEPLGIPFEVIVVDDGSTDQTLERAKSTDAIVMSNPTNSGYGSALKRGVLSAKYSYVAISDADGTYPPEVLPDLLAMCRDNEMVVGDRGEAMRNVPLVRRPAKWVLNKLASFLAQRHIPDLNSGLRVFRKSALLEFLPLLPDGFSFTTTITLCMICNGKRTTYSPIEYGKRIGQSKIRPVDFLNFTVLVLRVITLFNPLRVFIPLGLVFFTIGFLKFLYDITQWDLSETAIFSLLAAFVIWSLGLIADMITRLHLRP